MSTFADYYPGQTTPALARCLRSRGHAGVLLYVNRCTRAEVDAVLGAGLELALVFENMPIDAPYDFFDADRGERHAHEAIAAFARLGLPALVCYFAADKDLPPEWMDDYFNGVESVLFGYPLVPGVYGYRRMVNRARDQYPNLGRHLWQTYGNALDGPVDFWQVEQDEQCGITVDLNQAFVAGWTGEEGAMLSDAEKAWIEQMVEGKAIAIRDHIEAYLDARLARLAPPTGGTVTVTPAPVPPTATVPEPRDRD